MSIQVPLSLIKLSSSTKPSRFVQIQVPLSLIKLSSSTKPSQFVQIVLLFCTICFYLHCQNKICAFFSHNWKKLPSAFSDNIVIA